MATDGLIGMNSNIEESNLIDVGPCIAQKIIEEHNGHLNVRQTKKLPDDLYDLTTGFKVTVGGVQTMGDGHRILVVDDELGPREALRMILKSKYQVMTAVNGPDALQSIAKMPPDIVLLDIRMRQMNGIQVLQAIKQIDPTIEVIMITAYASLATAREAMAYEAVEYLTKPFSKQEVESAVEKAMARRAKRAGARLEVWTLLEQMRTLAYASSTAVGQHDLLRSASGLLDQGKQLFNSTAAVLYMLEEPSRRLRCKVVLGTSMQQRGAFESETWTALLSQILRARQPLILSQGQAAPP